MPDIEPTLSSPSPPARDAAEPARAPAAPSGVAPLALHVAPCLWWHARLSHDPVRGRPVLLYPEGVTLLNASSGAIAECCDGTRSVAEIGAALARQYNADVTRVTDDVASFVSALIERGVMRDARLEGAASGSSTTSREGRHPASALALRGRRASARAEDSPPLPTTLLAELTHRCPLHCPYCSNPLALTRASRELDTDDWCRVLDEARALGVLQLGLSGGEPLTRRDLEELIQHAHHLGLYTTLVTSGLGLGAARGAALARAGVEHIQLSLQDAGPEGAERVAGTRSWGAKMAAAEVIRELGVAFTVNVVLHRTNLDNLEDLVALAVELGAHRIELANTQYYGWAELNRAALMPSRAQVERAEGAVARARVEHGDAIQILYVLPDYHERYPKPCQGGWGRHYIVVAPEGRALPCHAASQITTLSFPSVRERSLEWIWGESPAFDAFRGEQWMPEPCRSCERRAVDFGGCRCQAFALTGDAMRTDPVCVRSPHRPLVDAMVAGADAQPREDAPVPFAYRRMRIVAHAPERDRVGTDLAAPEHVGRPPGPPQSSP